MSKSAGPSAHRFRQPLSCEPCRERKIKCSRTPPPCESCTRRKISDSCVYLIAADNARPSRRQLLKKITVLEGLLQKTNEKTNGQTNDNNSTNWEYEEDALSQSVPPTTLEGANELPIPPYAKSRTDFTFESDKVTGQNDIRAGTMKSNAAGDVQYEHCGSQWAAVLINTSITSLPLEGEAENENEHHSGLGVPFLDSSTLSIEDFVALLPSVRQCTYLKGIYFDIFSPIFHILHEPTFHAQYEAFLRNPYGARPSWLAVLFVILSLAITSLATNDSFFDDFRFAPGSDPYANTRALSKRYHMLTMKCLEKQGVLWGKHNVQSLQALILLGYAMSHSHEKIWVLLGMTYNVATGLACHVDPSNFDMNFIQCEERRRCWAGLTMLYTIHNVLLGTSDPGRPINTRQVQLPVDANDVDITAEGIVNSSKNGPTQLSYLLFKFQLDDLTAAICSEIFDSSTVSQEAISALDQKICLIQESWDARYTTDSNNLPLSVNQKMHLHILHGYGYQLFLLLHRPFFAQSISGLETPNESQIRCIASAQALLDIHRLIHETPEYEPFLWYSNGLGSFHAFHGAVVLAVALLMPIFEAQHRKFREILEDTTLRFKRLQGRSVICRKAVRVLDSLLAIISNQPSQSGTFPGPTPGPLSLLMLEPDHAPNYTGSTGNLTDMENSEKLEYLAPRLQSQQWISPYYMAWEEWDEFIPRTFLPDSMQ